MSFLYIYIYIYIYLKGLDTCKAVLDIFCMVQPASDWGREISEVQIYFSAAFDRVSHSGLLFKLRDVGVDGAVINVIAGFMSGRVQKGL